MTSTETVIRPRIDLAVNDPIELAGDRPVWQSWVDALCEGVPLAYIHKRRLQSGSHNASPQALGDRSRKVEETGHFRDQHHCAFRGTNHVNPAVDAFTKRRAQCRPSVRHQPA